MFTNASFDNPAGRFNCVIAHKVVPILKRAGFSLARLLTAIFTFKTCLASSFVVTNLCFRNNSLMAISDATSPPLWPPIPSATAMKELHVPK